jgi:hypothetical protein
MANFVQTVSGHAIVPAWGGPDNFLNVDGKGWTDQQGLGEDDGKRFRIRGGRVVDFYAPITNPVIFNDVRLQANYAAVTLDLPPGATLLFFGVWDRTTPIFTSPPLAVSGNYRRIWVTNQNAFVLTADFPVQGALVIKVTILASSDVDVKFTGAGIRFHN